MTFVFSQYALSEKCKKHCAEWESPLSTLLLASSVVCSIMLTCNAANSSQFHRLDSGEEVLVGVLEEEELLQLNIQQLEYK